MTSFRSASSLNKVVFSASTPRLSVSLASRVASSELGLGNRHVAQAGPESLGEFGICMAGEGGSHFL